MKRSLAVIYLTDIAEAVNFWFVNFNLRHAPWETLQPKMKR